MFSNDVVLSRVQGFPIEAMSRKGVRGESKQSKDRTSRPVCQFRGVRNGLENRVYKSQNRQRKRCQGARSTQKAQTRMCKSITRVAATAKNAPTILRSSKNDKKGQSQCWKGRVLLRVLVLVVVV